MKKKVRNKISVINAMKKVMIFGTFDILHAGHLYLFKQARKYGNYVIAVLARDERVQNLKKTIPFHTEKERKYFLDQIKLIDEAILGDKKDVYKVIKKFKPDVILLGYDQVHFTDKLREKIKEFDLKTKVVRIKAYKPERLKSTHARKILEK